MKRLVLVVVVVWCVISAAGILAAEDGATGPICLKERSSKIEVSPFSPVSRANVNSLIADDQQIGLRVPFSETVLDSQGQPVSGSHDLRIGYFGKESTESIWEELFPKVGFVSGRFDVVLGTGNVQEQTEYTSLQDVFLSHPEMEMQIAIDGVVQAPRVGILPAGHSNRSRALLSGAISEDEDDSAMPRSYRSKGQSTAIQAADLHPAGTDSEESGTSTLFNQENPFLLDMLYLGVSKPVREMNAPATRASRSRTSSEPKEINPLRHETVFDADGYRFGTRTEKIDDKRAQESRDAINRGTTPALLQSFSGIGATGYAPPDTEGAVGPNHYAQVVNVEFMIFDKSGNELLANELPTNSLWSGMGGACDSDNDGDAIFMYDEQADRWVLTQFAVSSATAVCFAVSTTPDPTGTFYLYQLDAQRFPDYYKLGVWPDANNNAYFMGTNSGSQNQYDVYAIDRASLLAGSTPNQAQYFQSYYNLMMPADIDGDTLPPTGSPGLFYTFRDQDESYFGSPASDSIDIYEFDVDWNTPANSTYTLAQVFTPSNSNFTDFNWSVCGFFVSDCLPQPGTNQEIDSASWWPMQRLQYRNQGAYETLVGTWTVDTESSGDHAAPRWFELRRSGATWTFQHEGTISPDSVHRFMPSIALDGSGNMGIGYSVVDGTSVQPGLRYATRDRDAALFNTESVMVNGSGVETGANRWGDYAAMEVDPVDDCTFWFTSEYIASTGNYNWSTYVASFKVPDCTGSICDADPPTGVSAVTNGANRIDVSWNSAVNATEYWIYRSQTLGGPYSQIGTETDPSTSYADTTVSGNVTYYYVVRTVTTCESGFSAEASATATGTCTQPPQFDGITSATNGAVDNPCTINLEWDPATLYCAGPLSYRVYRDTTSGFTPGAGTQIAGGVTCSGSPCTYPDTDALVSGTPYYYVVRAYDAAIGLEDNNVVEVTATPNGPGGGVQTLLDDDFEIAADWSNWTVTTGPGPHSCGEFARTNSATQMPANGSGYYALADSDACGNNSTTSTILTSPVVDCSAVTSDGFLSVEIYYNYYDGDDTTVEVFDGTDWVVIWSDTDADVNGTLSGDISTLVVGNADFQIRFSYQNAAYDYWFAVDDVLLTGNVDDPCTTGGSCTDPGAVSIDSIIDDDACAQDGVTITFSGGAGASSFDLWVDGAQTVTGISSPYAYDPGDTASHSYVVRAIDSSCFTDSSASNFTDAGLGTPSITSITDDDDCLQTGIHVNYTGGTDATSHDLLRNGTPVATGYVSGALYNPGNSTSYTYTIRANKGACTEVSTGSAFADVADAPGTPSVTGITDDDACAQTGIRVAYSGGSGATSHNLVRNGSVVVTGYVSGALYNPGDSTSYGYVVRAVNGACTTDSGSSAFADEDSGMAAPGAPSVADDDVCVQSGVTISWGAVSGATAYEVRIDGTTTIYTGSGTSVGYDPTNSNSHFYDVRASNAPCTSSWSAVTTATDDEGSPGTPAAPTVVDVASCTLSDVQVSWVGVAGATRYDLLVDGTTTVVGVTSPSNYTPGNSDSHTYAIRAVNICGNGAFSAATAGVDDDHSFTWAGLDTATDRDACDDTGVALRWSTPATWNDGNFGSRTFTTLRDGVILASGISESTIGIDDTTGVNGTSYDYSMVAVNGYGCTAGGPTIRSASDEVGSEPTFGGLQTVTAMPGDVCGLRLDWNAATSNCSNGPTIVYNIYRSETAGFTPDGTTLHDSCVADLFYEDHTVFGGTTYYYVVRAEDSSLGHGGPCGNGFEDSNTTEVSGLVSSGTTTVTVYSDDFDGSPTPADYWNTGYSFGNPYGVGHACENENFADDWHLPQSGFCTGNTAASNDGVSPYGYSDPNNGSLILGDPPVGGGPPYSDGGIVLPAGATSITLTFNHDYDFESDTSNWDGGRLMVSDDDWPTFLTITPVGGYPGTTVDSEQYCHPWPGQAAYTNDSGGCVSAEFDLTAYAGRRIWLAWNHGADNYNTADDGWFIDDVLIEAVVPGTACTTAADPVQHFAARSTTGTVKLEWQNPELGAYTTTRVCVDGSAFPTNPATCTLAAPDQSTGLNNYDTMTLTGLTNGNTYYYAAFVDNGAGEYSPAQTVMARPFNTSGQTKWSYHTSATALAPPGLYPGVAGTGASYGVSNDRVLHGMNSTDGGGDWPRTSPFAWMPMGMNGPAQSRPPVVPTTAVTSGGGGDLVAFLGSQDGHVYAANAKSGQTLWQSTQNYGLVQGAPSGMFSAFGGAYDLIFAGSRVAGSGNSMYGINLADGSPAWSFGGTMGIIPSGATVDYASNRLYFASRENPTGSNHTLWCISFTDLGAALVWSMPYGDIDAAPVLFDGVLYVGTNAGTVVAIDPATGEGIWKYGTNDGPVKGYIDFEFISGGPRKLFFATTNNVWAVTDNGTFVSPEWVRPIAGPSIPLTLADLGALYVGSTDGRLYQLDPADGSVVTSVLMGAGTATVGSPGYDWMNSLAYVGAEDGSVYAVTLPLQ